MGNSSSKDSKKANALRTAAAHAQGAASSQPAAAPPPPSAQERLLPQLHAHRGIRASRPELPFLGIVRDRDNAASTSDRPRETRQERDARKREKEHQARLKERERSLRDETVDGGYLVTLGTYTGPEDFSKPVVRQLQIERRLAPFWRGLDDHSESWTEAQLVAAARGLPIPAPDEIPPEMARTYSEASSVHKGSDVNLASLTVPISHRSLSHDSSTSGSTSFIQPPLSTSGPTSPTSPSPSSAQLLRGRAKTLASLATGSKAHSPDMTPQEMRLPRDPYVNGQPVEAYLYKDASECPICFMYYPPYLNKTRCCDQPICSECFVQIKRPDPHPPEHEQPGQQRPTEEDPELLVSEIAACPFCVTPEFGITYDPPPFRRGLAYAKQANGYPLQYSTSAMSSSSSLHNVGRRRTASISASAPQVITTDRVRPDWAKKLADARAHALRRSAAATALHNAAYVLGTQGDGQLRTLAGFRRRRSLFGESPTSSGATSPRALPDGMVLSPYAQMSRIRQADDANNDISPVRGSSRRTRVDDLEDLMMIEAIRLSIAAEEERKRKEEKEAKKEAKKKAKEDKKEAKAAKKGGASTLPLYQTDGNMSTSTMGSASPTRSESNLGFQSSSIPEEQEVQGKGKAPVQDFAGFIPLLEPTSTLNTALRDPENQDKQSRSRTNTFGSSNEDAQRHLEESRANLQPASGVSIPEPRRLSPHTRQMSETPSFASSINDSPSPPGSLRGESITSGSGLDLSSTTHDTRSGTPPLEPMFNFRSLTAMIEDESKGGSDHFEHAAETPLTTQKAEEGCKELPSSNGSPPHSSPGGESLPPPVYAVDEDQITPAPARLGVVHDVDHKEISGIEILGGQRRENVDGHQEVTQ